MGIVKKLATVAMVAALSMGLSVSAMAADANVKSNEFRTGVVTVSIPEFATKGGASGIDAVVNVIAAKNAANALTSVIPNGKDYNSVEFVTMFKNAKDPVGAAQDFVANLSKDANAALVQAAKAAGKDAKKDGYYISSKYRAYALNADLVSFSQTVRSYTGGAHDNSLMTTTTVNTRTGKYLSLRDMFDPKSEYKERLKWIIDSHQKTANRFKKEMGMAPVDFKKVKITGDEMFCYNTVDVYEWGLVIFFNPGEVAPVSEGIIEYCIPMDLIMDTLQDVDLR